MFLLFFCCSSLRSVKIEVGSTAVEVVRNGPGVSIMVPIKKNALKSLKISSDTGQIDESTFFSIYELNYLKRIVRFSSLSYRQSRLLEGRFKNDC